MRKKLALLLALLMLCSPVSTGSAYADLTEESALESTEAVILPADEPEEKTAEPVLDIENSEESVSEMPSDSSGDTLGSTIEGPAQDTDTDIDIDTGEDLPGEAEDPVSDPPMEIAEPVLEETIIEPENQDMTIEIDAQDIDLEDPSLGEKYFVVQYTDGTMKTMQVAEPETRGTLSLSEETADIESQMALYEEKSEVAGVEPLMLRRTADIHTTYTPDDLYYLDGSLWNIKAVEADRLYGWNFTRPMAEVTIAILDTGMDMDHPDLAGNLASVDLGDGVMVNGYDIVNTDDDPSDGDGHGTHVAGIAAALVNNGEGVAGVAEHVKILPIKVMNDAGEGSQTNVIKGIDWAIDHGADIISMSLGGPYESELEQQAINRAYAHGIIVVAAAGNYSNNWDSGPADIDLEDYPPGADVVHKRVMYPAACDHVIGVGALGRHKGQIALADFSNSGAGLDVVAPGEDVYSTVTDGNPSSPGAEYGYMSGTSMATPHVSALAALVLAEYPSYDPEEVETAIKEGSEMITAAVDPTYGGKAAYYGAGMINVYGTIAGDVQLKDLQLDAGTFMFDPLKPVQSLAVENGTVSIGVKPVKHSAGQQITINGELYDGDAFYPVSLNIGVNTVTIIVTAKDAVATATYMLTVVRDAPVSPPPVTSGGGGGGGGGVSGVEVIVRVDSDSAMNLNALTVTFPPNSTTSEFQAHMNQVTYSVSPFKAGKRLVDKVYSVDTDSNRELEKPMSLTFSIKSKEIDLSKERLAIFYLDIKTDKWAELEEAVVGTGKLSISGKSKQFTKYAVLAVTKEEPVITEIPVTPPALGIPMLPKTTFSDLSAHWSAVRVYALVDKNAIAGYPDGTFRPDAPITRSEFVAVLVKAQGMTGSKEAPFTDMAGHWAKDVIATAYANGVVAESPDGLFRPNDPITREQMAVMVDRTLRYASEQNVLPVADQAQIAQWAEPAIRRILFFKVMSGYPDNTFRPQAEATRAEAAVVVLKTITD